MKAIIIGIIATIASIASAIITKDATASVFLLPTGIGMIVEGIKNGDQIFEEA